ncbi:MAG: DEAD/DEAH box helicase [Candidatus Bathyarchaeia archaeon]
MLEEKNPFDLLVKPVRKLVEQRGFAKPTDPQAQAIRPILEGKNVLLIAPTGTGKTEAAFLPIFSRLLETVERPVGVKVLYITPLRSLNRDLLERLQWWCQNLDIHISVRHGDTEVRERYQQSRSPPDILITTPETLQAILPGRILRRHLKQIRWVIVDEIHEFAEDKRGTQLSLALERLRLITEHDFQIVGLSATIGSPELVAKFLVGTWRPVEVIRVPVARDMQLQILYPVAEPEDYELAAKLYAHPEVAARLRVMRKLIEGQNSVLLFTNTRSIAEVLASRFRVWDIDFPVSIHHGSLAKPARVSAEQGLKGGELKGLVCTSSLELGIDIGSIDLCIQYMSPRQVARLTQRVGRSGHRIGRVAKGIIVTMDSDDTLEAMVIARRALLENLEKPRIPEKPLDVLTHQLVGLLIHQRRWEFSQILDVCRKAFPYRSLEKADLVDVLEYMHSRYPRLAWVSFEDEVLMRPQSIKAMYQFYYENLSMIPDEKSYLVVDESNNTPVGILDETFVAEYGNPGTKFIVRGSPWKILSVYGDKVFVKAVDDPTGAIPSWVGEEIPVPFEVAEEVGQIRSWVEKSLEKGLSSETLGQQLASKYPINVETASRAIQETVEQFHKALPIPTHRRITVESIEGGVVVQVSFGTLVNRALAILLGHIIAEKTGQSVSVQEDPYRIVLEGSEQIKADAVKELLFELANIDIKKMVEAAVIKTGLFKRHMIHVARKFGAISKSADFSTVSLNQLEKSFAGTAIYKEALKETLARDFDLENLQQCVNRLKSGEVEIAVIKTEKEGPSPIARAGLEKIGRRANLMPSEKIDRLVLESTEARLLNEVKTFVCVQNWDYVAMMPIKEFRGGFTCPNCGSNRIGVLSETEDRVKRLIEKGGKNLTKREKELISRAERTAELIAAHGKAAAVALAGRGIRLQEVKELVAASDRVDDKFINMIVAAERRALARRFV